MLNSGQVRRADDKSPHAERLNLARTPDGRHKKLAHIAITNSAYDAIEARDGTITTTRVQREQADQTKRQGPLRLMPPSAKFLLHTNHQGIKRQAPTRTIPNRTLPFHKMAGLVTRTSTRQDFLKDKPVVGNRPDRSQRPLRIV